jgi:hypothetical protein
MEVKHSSNSFCASLIFSSSSSGTLELASLAPSSFKSN